MTDDKNAPEADSSADDSRRKFEEALERKRHRAAHGDGPTAAASR